MIVAIDFSITSPGVCLIDNLNQIHFACFPYKDVVKDYIIDSLQESGVYCKIRERNEDKTNLTTQSRFHMQKAVDVGNDIVDWVKSFHSKLHKDIIIFEGFSFNSGGNRLAQISGYQYISRYLLIDEISTYENLIVYAPQSVKATARAAKKGMGKNDMIQAFLEHDNKFPELEKNDFYRNLLFKPEMFKNIPTKRTKKIVFQKPIDDLIDAYWILQTYFKKENIDYPKNIF